MYAWKLSMVTISSISIQKDHPQPNEASCSTPSKLFPPPKSPPLTPSTLVSSSVSTTRKNSSRNNQSSDKTLEWSKMNLHRLHSPWQLISYFDFISLCPCTTLFRCLTPVCLFEWITWHGNNYYILYYFTLLM